MNKILLSIILIVLVLAIFAFGYFITVCFGKYMEEHLRVFHGPQTLGRKTYLTEEDGKRSKTASEEANDLLDSLNEFEDNETAPNDPEDPEIIEYLKQAGCKVRYRTRR